MKKKNLSLYFKFVAYISLLAVIVGILLVFNNGLSLLKTDVSLAWINFLIFLPLVIIVGSGLIILFFIVSNHYAEEQKHFTLLDITEIAILVAIAIVLDTLGQLKIHITGGSIGFAMVPLFLIALRHDFYKSFIAIGIVFGLSTLLLDGYGFNPLMILFDYVLGFGSLAVLSFFRPLIFKQQNKVIPYVFITIGILIGGLLRFIFSSISSMLVYEASFTEAIIYQSAYIPLSILLCLIIINLLHPTIMFLNKRLNNRKEEE
ncbi:MAG: energy-coupled thiamine transporter ThiT [Bacillales bacterium]|jgi:thiamine transporter|nr:energy-coupled thiamine transporter ThiT [Bacillales bacterium]